MRFQDRPGTLEEEVWVWLGRLTQAHVQGLLDRNVAFRGRGCVAHDFFSC